jgi:drug/metabolite transporter (DMT)-like permease
VSYLLALSSAFLYGAADFMGGFTSRRADTIAVVLIAQFAGLLSLALLLPLLPAVSPLGNDLLWGAVAGVCGSVGVALLYRGLAVGTMSIVAPTTAVCAVVVPVAVALAGGERLSWVTGSGIVLAMIGIVLVGQQTNTAAPDPLTVPAADVPNRRMPPGLGLALLSGIAIGGFYLSLARASDDAGLWPLLVARGASVALFGAIALIGARPLKMPAVPAMLAIVAGVVDMAANALYLAATWSGELSLVVTLASLYPASTVMMARFFLSERLNTVQAVGVICALIAVAAIVAGS